MEINDVIALLGSGIAIGIVLTLFIEWMCTEHE